MTVYEGDKEEKEIRAHRSKTIFLQWHEPMYRNLETIRQVHQGYKSQINCTSIY